MNMNMMIVSNSSSTTLGVGSSFTPCPLTRTIIKSCYSPNAKPRSTFSLGLSTSLNFLSNPTWTTLIVTRLNSGLEASITDSNENSTTLADANMVVESGDENKIQLRVDLTGDQTQMIFDKILANLARTAPPVPGFRMRKGGKSSKENLDVKDRKISTTQTAEELKQSFTPGSEFGFKILVNLLRGI